MPRPDDTIAHSPSSSPSDPEGTLAGDGTLDVNGDRTDDPTLQLNATRGRPSVDSDATLAGDGTFADEPEGTVDAERTLFDHGEATDDRTLAGDDFDGSTPASDATFLDDPTFEEDRTIAEGAQKKRRREPIDNDTFDDPTIATSPAAQDESDDRTLIDLPGAKASLPADDQTFMDLPAASGRDADATVAGDLDASPNDDRTIVGDDPVRPHSDDDRTIVGDEPPARASGNDRTIAGDEPEKPPRDGQRDETKPPHEPAKTYDLIEDFARGGMGKIWRAMDLRIRREVAYKELLPNALKNPVVVERFLKEAQVTGQLEHPGIVPIYDLGWQDNGTPFYSMKLVRGTTFKKPIEEYHALPKGSSERRLAFTKLLQQFVAICNTLGYSHERNVLHRDLKPLNIMVGDFGETLVLDWGLARIINDPDNSPMGDGPFPDEDTIAYDGTVDLGNGPRRGADDIATQHGASHGATQGGATHGATQPGQTTGTRRQSVVTDYGSEGSKTLIGSVMGTPAYMPPEQARGLHNELDGRSDLYSLGAIFYEILTNRAPIAKGKLPEMLKAVVEGTIEPPRKIDPTIPRSLEAVCMKSLAKDKKDRYPNAVELAREVERYLADEPVTAYKESLWTRAGRWIRRHPTFVTTISSVFVFGLLGLGIWSKVESNRIAGIERSARERIAAAKSAIESSGSSYERLEQAGAPLREAAALVESEPKLASLQIEIKNDLEDLARDVAMRRDSARDTVSRQAQEAMQRAEQLIAGDDALDKALDELQEISASLAPWPDLSVLAATIEARKAELRTRIEQRDARLAAKTKYDRFLGEVDQARFFGSLFSSGSIVEHSQAAKEHAEAALKEYGFDQPNAPIPAPELLTESQQKELIESCFEVLMILADAEMKLAGDGTPAAQKAGAQKALVWLDQAKTLPIVSKVLPYREHLAYERLGDRTKANDALEQAESRKASTALDCYLLGQEARHFGKIDDALTWYQEALRFDPEYFWALQSIGLCHLRQGHPEAAVASYTAAIAARPKEPICYLTRAIAFGDLKQQQAAKTDLKKAEELGAAPYELMLNRGGVAFQFSDFDGAIADFTAASKMEPSKAGPLKNLGNTLRIQADGIAKGAQAPERAQPIFEQAVAALTTAIEKEPNDPSSYAIRGDVLVRLKKDPEAVADFLKAATLALHPTEAARALAEIGRIQHRIRRLPQALAAYEQSLAAYGRLTQLGERTPEIDDEEAGIHRLRAEVLNSMGQLQEADAAWSKALALGKPVGDIYRGRALSRAARKMYRDAMNDYTRALELEKSPNMLTRRGWAYLLQANQLALADFTDAIKENPENPDSYNGRGYARVQLGDVAGAVADADEAIQRDKAAAAKGQSSWENLYNASTIFAQAVDRTEKDKTKSDEEREKLAKELTTKAIDALKDAGKAAGPKGQPAFLGTIKADTALDPIRQKPEFTEAFK